MIVFRRCILLFSILCFISVPSFSQVNLCAPINAGNDTIICEPATVQLSASPGYSNYVWYPSVGLDNPYVRQPHASITSNVIYTVSASTSNGNLINNGDFSLGDAGFSTDYTPSINYSPCNYYVGGTFFNSSFVVPDHTSSSNGMFMSIDGCPYQSVLWEQTISSIPSQANFNFSFWATRAGANQPVFGIYFIGNVTGLEVIDTLYGLPPVVQTAVWDMYSVPPWSSGLNTSVIIRIVCLTDEIMGIDFAMDDLSFTTDSCNSTDSVAITLVQVLPPVMDNDTLVCRYSVLAPLQSLGQNIQWYSSPSVSIGNMAPVPATNTFNSITYYSSQTIQGCESDLDSITIDIMPLPAFDLGTSQTICIGDEIKIGPSDDVPWNYLWMDSLQSTPRYISDGEDKTYILMGENFCGTYLDSLEIKWDECLCYFYYPNTFTPNDDVNNEQFKPIYDCRLEEFTMRIFNGWGELIFETENPEYGWSGQGKSKPAQQGVYTVQINYTALSGSKKVQKSIVDKLALLK